MMSQTAEYALLAVIALANEHPNSQSVGRVAAATNVPPGYLSKVLQKLARAKVVTAHRGAKGGFSLAQDPAKINVLDVINAVAPLKRSHLSISARDSRQDYSAIGSLLSTTYDFTEQAFRNSTIESMVIRKTSVA